MIRQIRLATGLILFAYVTSHLLNHTLGLISIHAMEAGRFWFVMMWRNPIGTAALYSALLIHFALALWAIYDRSRLRYGWSEAFQLGFGLSVPILLAGHVVGTRLAYELAGTNDSYTFVLLVHFRLATQYFWMQSAGLFAAWIHGCIGMHYWLRLKPFYPRMVPGLFAVAVLLPVLAWLGYVMAGREVLELSLNETWRRFTISAIGMPDKAMLGQLIAIGDGIKWSVGIGVLLALGARPLRAAIAATRGIVRITYPDGAIVSVRPGTSILDCSRNNGIPHASVCGGRGRCSTCRVRVVNGAEALPSPSTEEQRVLERIGAPSTVRLACQTRPTTDLSIMPLLPPSANVEAGYSRPAFLTGEEREIVVLFADLRDFTGFSERRLPYDVVFVLNRYFAHMGEAVNAAGGHLDKFTGDGVMALFGVGVPPVQAALQALDAARRMVASLSDLNAMLENDLDVPLRIGIGLHAGPAIIGEMGYGQATSLTAVGDTVNTASRLEAMTKEYGAEIVVSETVAALAGVDLGAFPSHDIEVRGRTEPVRARIIKSARELELPTVQK
ncbi:MAG: adenylate/guanylate cyclase domain-containing protein [Alphaproteobacteria bacterium]